jgi:hypothetical protein
MGTEKRVNPESGVIEERTGDLILDGLDPQHQAGWKPEETSGDDTDDDSD